MAADRPASVSAPDFLTGGGDVGAMMRSHDWSVSPLGPPVTWPQSLRSVVGLLLNSRFPMFVAWGPELGFLYNDPYAEFLGAKHPAALGSRFHDIWSEIWPDISPLIDAALAGEASYHEDLPLTMNRKGFDEQGWFTFSYSPARDESGAVAGMFCTVIETTPKVRAVEQLRESEAELRFVTDALPVLISYIDRDYRYRFANKAYEEWFGISNDQVIGRTMAEVLGEKAFEQVHSAVDGALAGERQSFERQLPYRFGEPRHVHVDYVPDRSPHGQVTGFYALVNDISEAKQAEAALRESEARFREQFENANDFLFTADLEMRITTCNPAVAAALGWTPAELVGRSIAEFVPPNVWELNKAMLGVKLAGKEDTTRYEVEVFNRRGEHMIWEINSRLTRDASGAPNGLHAIGRDVTERRHAENELRESEARLRALTDHLPGGMVYQIATGKDGSERRFLYVSQSHERLTGIPAEAVLADPMIPYNLIVPEDRPKLAEAEAAAIRERRMFDVEARFRRADGETRWCRIISAPREQPDGSLVWDGIQIDITEGKVKEAALSTSEQQLRLATEAAEIGLWDVDMVTGTWFWPPRVKAMFGISPEATATMEDFYAGLHPDDLERTAAAFSAALDPEKRALYDVEYRTIGKEDGVLRWVAAKGRGLFDDDGACVRAIGTAIDITERKAVEAALRDSEGRLRELNETLEQRVQQRTAELEQAHEQLRQSQKLEAMGQLTGGVAHDFNNLLTPIIGSLDLLQRRGLGGAREQRLIDGALQSADRAKTLVQRLLAFARRQPLQATAVDVAGLVGGMAELIASTSGPNIELVVDVADDLPAAKADPNQLELAILNLSVNARDAMPAGGRLTISAAAEVLDRRNRANLEPGRYVRLSVADTGIGMDETTLAKAIEPFFSTKGVGKGTGLGLSMVHGLASQLGGALIISSKPGLGTNAELWLPASDAAAPAGVGEASAAPGVRSAGTALLVDDEELVRMSTADMLTEIGYAVTEAASAEEALRMIESGLKPDVLVTDHLMPGMTGADLARTVREARPGTPVLIVSGYAEAEGVAPDLARLTKPFRQEDLAARLAELTTA